MRKTLNETRVKLFHFKKKNMDLSVLEQHLCCSYRITAWIIVCILDEK